MAFGDLDRRIVIQNNTQSQLGNGEPVDSWSTFVTLWATAEFGLKKAEGEDYEAGQLTASNTVGFKVRYYPGITEQMRISYDSTYYNITHIEEVGRERFLILKATKVD